MIWIVLAIAWATWVLITVASIVESRRQHRSDSWCVTAIIPFALSVVLLIVNALSG